MRQRASVPRSLAPAVAMLLALGVLLAACGTSTKSPSPTTGGTPPPGTAPAGSGAGATVRAYFGLGSTTGQPVLAPVLRSVPEVDAVGVEKSQALQVLIDGPREAELSGSPAMFTAVPEDTELLGVESTGNGVWLVNLSDSFTAHDELPQIRTALAQVVFTLTQFADVTGVEVAVEGQPLQQTDPTGRALGVPATRADYEDQMGPILVDDPVWGATLRSPFRLAGLADVFEAQFRFRLLDAEGRSLADGPLMASCGTGCLGTYGVEVPFTVTAPTEGRLQVFDPSEVDGSMSDVVDYPVTLLP
jgi:hypothetical protein